MIKSTFKQRIPGSSSIAANKELTVPIMDTLIELSYSPYLSAPLNIVTTLLKSRNLNTRSFLLHRYNEV